MADTKFNAEDVRSSAKALGGIMSDMAVFEQLKPHWPNAGLFATAQWLERVVDDRRNGIVEHANRLKTILDNLNSGLTAIATNLESADKDNAKEIQKRLESIESTIDTEISSMNERTEKDQRNFSEGDDAPADNDTDGDGYNDVLDEDKDEDSDPDYEDDDYLDNDKADDKADDKPDDKADDKPDVKDDEKPGDKPDKPDKDDGDDGDDEWDYVDNPP